MRENIHVDIRVRCLLSYYCYEYYFLESVLKPLLGDESYDPVMKLLDPRQCKEK